jgi:hypothetical protein
MVYSCGPVGMFISEKVMITVASQLSVAVAVPVLAGKVLAVHCMVTFGGQVIKGARLSSTEITWTQVLEFEQSSVAFQVRLIVLSWGHVPPIVTSLNVRVGVASQ